MKYTFSVTEGDKELKLAVVSPTNKQQEQAQKIENKAFRENVESGALLRPGLEKAQRERGIWGDSEQVEYEELQKEIIEKTRKIKAGGIKLSEGRKIALDLKLARARLNILHIKKMTLDTYTAEAQAEAAKFNYLLAICTVYNDTGEKYFKDYNDLKDRIDSDVARAASKYLANIIYNVDEDFERKLPENAFLLKYKFCDNKLRLINKDGHLVDVDDHLIDQEGRLIKQLEDGSEIFVDRQGNQVDANGEPLVTKKFLDDDGNEVD